MRTYKRNPNKTPSKQAIARRNSPQRLAKEKAYKLAFRAAHPHRVWAINTIAGHRKRGYDVSGLCYPALEKKAQAVGVCRYCHRTLVWNHSHEGGAQAPLSPTMDRINNELVLTLDNIQIICSQCNTTKGARTHTEFVHYLTDTINNINNELHG